jgi:hypothetical protein
MGLHGLLRDSFMFYSFVYSVDTVVQIYFLNFEVTQIVLEYYVQDVERLMKEGAGKQKSLCKIEKLWMLLLLALKGPPRGE